MDDPTIPPGLGPEAHRQFVSRMRAAAREKDERRIEEWRNRTPEEHGAALVQVLKLAAAINRSKGVEPAVGEPLMLPEALRRHGVKHGYLPPREGDPAPER